MLLFHGVIADGLPGIGGALGICLTINLQERETDFFSTVTFLLTSFKTF